MNQRLMIYRRIAAARSEDELTRVMEELRDRYGPPPTAVLNLADYGRIRVLADGLGVEAIEREGSVVVFRFREKAKVDPGAHRPPGQGAQRPAACAAGLAQAGPQEGCDRRPPSR